MDNERARADDARSAVLALAAVRKIRPCKPIHGVVYWRREIGCYNFDPQDYRMLPGLRFPTDFTPLRDDKVGALPFSMP